VVKAGAVKAGAVKAGEREAEDLACEHTHTEGQFWGRGKDLPDQEDTLKQA